MSTSSSRFYIRVTQLVKCSDRAEVATNQHTHTHMHTFNIAWCIMLIQQVHSLCLDSWRKPGPMHGCWVVSSLCGQPCCCPVQGQHRYHWRLWVWRYRHPQYLKTDCMYMYTHDAGYVHCTNGVTHTHNTSYIAKCFTCDIMHWDSIHMVDLCILCTQAQWNIQCYSRCKDHAIYKCQVT